MLNNRQGGRRRGRGGQRPQGGANRPEQGNRIDNRARGNAAQLLEKYKSLARDAQTQGDRVNAEYFLQFADHYFRVLGESRARFDEQRRQRDDYSEGDEFDGDDNRQDYASAQGGDDDRAVRDRDQDRPRRDRDRDQDRPRRDERAASDDEDRGERRPANEGVEARDEGDRRPRRAPRPRRERMNGDHDEPAGFDATLLPPSISVVESAPEAGDEPAPRRRARRSRVVDDLPEGTPDAA